MYEGCLFLLLVGGGGGECLLGGLDPVYRLPETILRGALYP